VFPVSHTHTGGKLGTKSTIARDTAKGREIEKIIEDEKQNKKDNATILRPAKVPKREAILNPPINT
jgi:hypothetical protein